MNSNGITGCCSSTQNGPICTSSPYISAEASEMLAVGGHRGGATNTGGNINTAAASNKNCGGGQ